MDSAFWNLPEEVVLRIFSNLTPTDLTKSVSLVCQQWRILSRDPHLWKQVEIPMASFFKKRNQVEIISSFLQRCTRLECLSFKGANDIFDPRNQLPNNLFSCIGPVSSLKALSFSYMWLQKSDIAQIAVNYPFIENLSFKYCVKEYVLLPSCFRQPNMYSMFGNECLNILTNSCLNLKSLVVEHGDLTEVEISSLAKLQVLKLAYFSSNVNNALFNSYEHIENCKKLASLTLTWDRLFSRDALAALSNMPVLEQFHIQCLELPPPSPHMLKRHNSDLEKNDETEQGFAIFFSNPYRAKLRVVVIKALSIGEPALINMSQTCCNLKSLTLKSCNGVTNRGISVVRANLSKLGTVEITSCKPLILKE